MPRNGEGTYSLPAGSLANTGDTILVSQHNPPLTDIAQALTNSVDRDGTGGMRADLNMGGFKATNLAPGTEDTDAATVGQLTSGGGVPVGTVADFAGSSAPSGWLLCAGQSISRTTYADLFAVIGTTYGSASGSTFNLPDCRGRVSAGLDFDSGGVAGRLTATTMTPNGTTLGAVGGTQTVTLTESQMPAHTHTLSGSTSSDGAHTHTYNEAVDGDASPEGGGQPVPDAMPGTTGSSGAHTHTLSGTATSTGGGTAHGNVQPTILFNKIIRASAS